MKKEQLTLKDSVLKLNLSNESLEFLDFFRIYTVSDLLANESVIRDNKRVYDEISIILKKNKISFDTKLKSSSEIKAREGERKQIRDEKVSNFKSDKFTYESISTLNLSKRIISKLNNIGITSIKDLLLFSPIELLLKDVLKSHEIIKITEELFKYGYSFGEKDQEALVEKDEVLESVVITYVDVNNKNWHQKLKLLKNFYNENKHIIFVRGYKYEGVHFWEWLSTQRTNYHAGKLSPEAIDELDSMQMIWNPSTKEGKKQKRELLDSLGIEKFVLDGNKQIPIYKEASVSNENNEIVDDQAEDDKQESFVTLSDLKQKCAELEAENERIREEIAYYDSFIENYKAQLKRNRELRAIREELDDNIYKLLFGDSDYTLESKKTYVK